MAGAHRRAHRRRQRAPTPTSTMLLEVGESICPGDFPHAASERLGLEAVPFPYKMTTICFVGPSAYAPIHSALTLFREEFEAQDQAARGSRRPRWTILAPSPSPSERAHRWPTDDRDQPAEVAAPSRPPRRPRPSRSTRDAVDAGARAGPERRADHDQRRAVHGPQGRAGHRRRRARTATYIPRFCYHDADEPGRHVPHVPRRGRQPAAARAARRRAWSPVAPDMKVETESPTAKRAQEGIIELLLANHPLDCPVCDKGGECPLQDQAFSHGPGESRYVEEKRHFEKPIPISDLVLLDRERCILCDRCTRFADEVAGDPLIHFTERGNETQVMTFPDEPFSRTSPATPCRSARSARSPPRRTGSRPARGTSTQVESTCTTCSVGCRIVVQSSRDELRALPRRRQRPGQLGLAVRPRPLRLRGRRTPTDRLDRAARARRGRARRDVVERGDRRPPASSSARRSTAAGPQRIAVLGGARGTNEDAFAWARSPTRSASPTATPSSATGCRPRCSACRGPRSTRRPPAPTIILLGPDLKEELPVLYLRLRHAAEQRKVADHRARRRRTGLTPLRLAQRPRRGRRASARDRSRRSPTHDVADQLARRTGRRRRRPCRTSPSPTAAAASPRCRRVLDAVPGRQGAAGAAARQRRRCAAARPARRADGDLDAAGILRPPPTASIDLLVLLGADPISDFPDADLARRALAGARRVIAVDTFLTDSSALADVVLAAAAFGEKAGTTTNLEGRVTTVSQQVTPPARPGPDWMIAAELAELLGHDDARRHADVGRRDHRRDRRDGAGVRRRDPGRAATAAATVSSPCRARGRRRRPTIASPPPSATATTTGSWSSRKLYDRAVGTAHVAVARPARRPGGGPRHPLDLDRIGVGRRRRRPDRRRRRASIVLPLVADAGGAARHAARCRSTSRARTDIARAHRRRRAAGRPTSGSSAI